MNIGVIGLGARLKSIIGEMNNFDQDTKIKAVVDPDQEKAKQILKDLKIDCDSIKFYKNHNEMMDNEKLDGVMIGTRCALHSKIAIDIFKYSIPVFLEKPVATTMEDLIQLRDSYEKYKPEVVVSFPLRVSQIVELAKEIIISGQIGTVENVQAINNVPYGGIYFHNWYRDENETGGLFLQKATHDFDYINYLLDLKPKLICAMQSKQIFKGNRKEIYCKDCKDFHSCEESPYVMNHFKDDDSNGDMCCFSKETGNHDSASVIIKYNSGMHVSYSQNFFARKTAASRGARLLGYKGTLEFDWVKDELVVHMHSVPRVDTYKFDTAKIIHGGGDAALMQNFIEVMQKKAKSKTPLEAGMLSVLMCLKAKESALNNTFLEIDYQ